MIWNTCIIFPLGVIINDWKDMQNICVNGRFRNEYESDFHSNEHYLRSSENKALKKNLECNHHQ